MILQENGCFILKKGRHHCRISTECTPGWTEWLAHASPTYLEHQTNRNKYREHRPCLGTFPKNIRFRSIINRALRNRKRYCIRTFNMHTKKLQSEIDLPFRLLRRHRRLAWSSETSARREVVAAWTDCMTRHPGAWWPEVVHRDENLRDLVSWSHERWLAAKRTLPGPPMQPISLCSCRNTGPVAW